MRDTVFGRLLHLASGGRLFRWEEEKDPTILERYLDKQNHSQSQSPDRNSLGEEGKDNYLVGWSENDQGVRDPKIPWHTHLTDCRTPCAGRHLRSCL